MKFDLNSTKKIEAYLEGGLTGNELKEFNEELEKNETLRKEVQLQKDIHSGLIKKGKKDLKNELDNYYQEYVKNKNKGNSKIIRFLIPAISVAACILLFVFVFVKDNEKLDSSEEFITLDSIKINKASNYADSATYKDGHLLKIDTIQ